LIAFEIRVDELEPSDVGCDAGQRLSNDHVNVAGLGHLAKLLDNVPTSADNCTC
jgi:hypothetical protein